MSEQRGRSRRSATRRKESARAEQQRNKMVVEIVFGDPDEPPNTQKPANTAGDDSHNGSRPLTNRFVFRF